jgi:hypothetical protein
VGLLGRGGPFSAAALYQLARWACGLLALGVMYGLAAHVFRPVLLRRFAWLAFALGSGFGWLMVLFNWFPPSGIAPADFSQLDLFGFLTLLLTPHFALTEALLWAMALAFLKGWGGARRAGWWLAGGVGLAFLAQAVQLFAPLPLDLALVLFALWHWIAERRLIWRQALSLLALAAIQLPWAVYSLWVFQQDAGWRSYLAQNQLPALPVLDYLLGLGGLGLLAAVGLWYAARRRGPGALQLLALWVVVTVAAVYWPSPLQRRFVAGVIGPLAILATLGMLRGIWPAIRRLAARRANQRPRHRRLRAFAFGLGSVFLAQSSLWLLAGLSLTLLARHPIYFDSADEWHAMRWLGAHTHWDDAVFASNLVGNAIPAVIGHRVYVGHWAESVDYLVRVAAVERYYAADTPPAERLAIIQACQCRYLFYGPRERVLGPLQPQGAEYLAEVYRNPSVTIYAIELDTAKNPSH